MVSRLLSDSDFSFGFRFASRCSVSLFDSNDWNVDWFWSIRLLLTHSINIKRINGCRTQNWLCEARRPCRCGRTDRSNASTLEKTSCADSASTEVPEEGKVTVTRGLYNSSSNTSILLVTSQRRKGVRSLEEDDTFIGIIQFDTWLDSCCVGPIAVAYWTHRHSPLWTSKKSERESSREPPKVWRKVLPKSEKEPSKVCYVVSCVLDCL